MDMRLPSDGIRTFQFASYTASSVRRKHTHAIRAPFIVYLSGLGFRQKVESTKKKSKHTGKYDTPTELGDKMAVGRKICADRLPRRRKKKEQFYQYTVIEEASRKRFIYAYQEHSQLIRTVDFVKRAIIYFGYAPNGRSRPTAGPNSPIRQRRSVFILLMFFATAITFSTMCSVHRTPWHNGKVERSHRNDQERFYNYLSFYSFATICRSR